MSLSTADQALVGDAVTNRRPHGTDAVIHLAAIGDERSIIGAVGVDEPESRLGYPRRLRRPTSCRQVTR